MFNHPEVITLETNKPTNKQADSVENIHLAMPVENKSN